MENNAYIFDLLKMLLPALLVLLTTWLVLKRPAAGDHPRMQQTLPLRLQAYERLVMLVERITPSSLLVRNHRPGITAMELNAVLIAEVRAEFEHNISQQLYVSERSWQMIRALKDETVAIINGMAQRLPPEAGGMDLTKALLKRVDELENNPYEQTLAHLKEEVKGLF